MDQVVPYVATPRTNYLDFLLIWHSRVLRKNSISKIHEITAVQKKKVGWEGIQPPNYWTQTSFKIREIVIKFVFYLDD